MELNDIKKELYKQKPIAHFESFDKENAFYTTGILYPLGDVTRITFMIPISEIGDTRFYYQMEAKHLIRYIVKE